MSKKHNLRKNFSALKDVNFFTLLEIAKKIGINLDTLNQYLSGKTAPSILFLGKTSSLFQISIDFLLFGTNQKYINHTELFKLSENSEQLKSMPKKSY